MKEETKSKKAIPPKYGKFKRQFNSKYKGKKWMPPKQPSVTVPSMNL